MTNSETTIRYETVIAISCGNKHKSTETETTLAYGSDRRALIVIAARRTLNSERAALGALSFRPNQKKPPVASCGLLLQAS